MAGAVKIYDAVAESDGVAGLDRPVLDAAIALRTPASDAWVTAFTNLGRTLPMVVVAGLLTLALFLTVRRRTIWVLMLVAAAGSVTFTLVGKAIVGRSRPPIEQAVPPYEDSFSFPSGHALNSTVVAGMLAYLVVWLAARAWVRWLAVAAALLWAVAMGLSRVFLGHHWLTDVMFAWLFGLAWLALLITVHRLLLARRVPRAIGAG
jgi:undecaprenyl-diphosphatase